MRIKSDAILIESCVIGVEIDGEVVSNEFFGESPCEFVLTRRESRVLLHSLVNLILKRVKININTISYQ